MDVLGSERISKVTEGSGPPGEIRSKGLRMSTFCGAIQGRQPEQRTQGQLASQLWPNSPELWGTAVFCEVLTPL